MLNMAIRLAVSLLLTNLHPVEPGLKYSSVGKSELRFELVSFSLLSIFRLHDCRKSAECALGSVFVPLD